MSEGNRDEIMKQYSYAAMSNKVERSHRSRRRNDGEATGTVEALIPGEHGRMGDRVQQSALPGKGSSDGQPPKKKTKSSLDDRTKPVSASTTIPAPSAGMSILELGTLSGYHPTTEASKAAYEAMLTELASRALLGTHQSPPVVRDALEETLAILKDDHTKDKNKHELLSDLLTGKSVGANGAMSTPQFTKLLQLSKQLDDYGRKPQPQGGDDTVSGTVDNDMGVAVVFDDEDGSEGNENEDSDVDVGVVQDYGSSSDDEDEDGKASNDEALNAEAGETAVTGNDVLVQGGDDEKSKKKAKTGDRVLSVHEIDAHFLQRQISPHVEHDAEQSAALAAQVLDILDIRGNVDTRECENRLLVLLGFDMFNVIKLVLRNRIKVWSCVMLKRATTADERSAVQSALQATDEGQQVWNELNTKGAGNAQDWSRERMKEMTDAFHGGSRNDDPAVEAKDATTDDAGDRMDTDDAKPTELDLDVLAFRDGSHTMTNKKCELPDTSWRAMKKEYEEVHVPAVRSVIPKDEKLVQISELPEWTRSAFQGMDKLNRVQSKMCDIALRSSENLLLCAPTGAGKTNVACLTMMNILGQYRIEPDQDEAFELSSSFDLQSFKMIYVAPMKALVQEVVKNFSERLKDYGMTVRELSGDSSLTRQQIADTQLIVTTPEKWDIVTRQGEGRAFTQLVKLVIIDEIHLLHDERGPVLESIVARVIRQVETNAEPIRLVGLSATLPNYTDVAAFLRVDPQKGLFFFDHSYRPVPLQMQYVGITERNAFKRIQLQNEICYEKATDQRRNGQQLLIFVHSRAETGKTAKALRDIAQERDELSSFVRDGAASQEILREESASAKNSDLKDVLPYGFAIHHAGMAREDRELVEDLFADRHIAVLCTTATLAWGVNLPAHAVIIKGTQIYNPSKGRWAELSPLDVLQMLGRAGRPQYDSEGEGIILTQHSELQYYLSLTNLQLPVESQLIKALPDHLNAEIVLGTIQSIDEAVDWLSYTFLYVRMLQNPPAYGISNQTLREDPALRKRRRDLVHSAATILEKCRLVIYDRRSGSLLATPLGRVSSQFYISHSSMAVYSRHMRPNLSDIELLRLFSLSGEFAHITVREEEKLELAKLAGRVPIPIKEGPSEPSAKVNILLQAYISKLKLDGFALRADMAFIQQSAARIMRALFEISLRRKWAALAKLCLDFSNMVSYRMWRSQSPLRQFGNVPEIVARKLERKSDIEWGRYGDLSPSDLGELVGVPKMGRVLYGLVQKFPRIDLAAQIQPITRSLLRVELTITPQFQFDVAVHGFAQLFHVLVEDINGELILHYETRSLKSRSSQDEYMLVFTAPILDPLPPAYFVRVISDRWLQSASTLPISLGSLILPAKFPPPTELLDLQPLLPKAVGEVTLAKLFTYQEFNPIQTQTFHELFKTDRNCLVCAPSGAGKSCCAEFAILRMLMTDPNGRCVYLAPTDDIADPVFEDWGSRFGSLLSSVSIARLTGETTVDLKLASDSNITIGTVNQWDVLSRRWKQRKTVQDVTLMIFDEVHFLGGEHGPILEAVISRMRFMSNQIEKAMRIVGLSASLANAKDVGEWMGVSEKSLFNFSPRNRPQPLEMIFQPFEQSNYSARLLAMAKPIFNAIENHASDQQTIVYVPSRTQAQLTAIDIASYKEAQSSHSFRRLGHNESESVDLAMLNDTSVSSLAKSGVAFVHSGMIEKDWNTVLEAYRLGLIHVLVCPAELCWKIRCVAQLVVVMGTETYDGREGRRVDYPIVNLLHMLGRQPANKSGKCVILCHSPKKDYLKKLLYDPLPIESHLDSYLHDPLNAEIVAKTIASMQDAVDYLTWSFIYRRFSKNPSYYGLRGTSNVHLSEHLSEMIETIVGDLEESKCCNVDDEGNISPLNLGMIAAYYNVQYRTIELVASSVTAKTKIRGIIEILSASWEYSALPMRMGEEKALKMAARTLQYPPSDDASYDSHTKVLVLLQCHFSRKLLSAELRMDMRVVLAQSVNLLQAIVDVISSNGWLKPALAAMELSQMVVQGMWNKDHVLKQIPHFTDEIVQRCVNHDGEDKIESVFDILTLDDEVRNRLLQLSDEKMADVAVFCNNYPSIEVTFTVNDPDDIAAGDPVRVVVDLDREIDEDEMTEEELASLGTVAAPLFPGSKRESWWIVLGDMATNSLLALKRVNLRHKQKAVLDFLAPVEAGDYDLTLFCMSDSYLGCDQEYNVSLNVAAGASDGSESDSDKE